MKISYSPYTKVIQYGVIVMALLSGFAFYPGYIGIEKKLLPWFVHSHTFLMVSWMIMLFIQAYLIKTKKFKIHHGIGKLSYLVMPLLLFFMAMMLPFSYDRNVASYMEGSMPQNLAILEASSFLALPVFYFIGLPLFYVLAITSTSQPLKHGQYMVAATLMLTGPVFDRTLFIYGLPAGLSPAFPWETISFIVMDIVFLWILLHSMKKKISLQPAIVTLSYFLTGQILYLFGNKSETWFAVVRVIFQ